MAEFAISSQLGHLQGADGEPQTPKQTVQIPARASRIWREEFRAFYFPILSLPWVITDLFIVLNFLRVFHGEGNGAPL